MTNVVVNNLNNMDEMFLSGSKTQKVAEDSATGMDKSTDFDAIFDKSIGKVKEKVADKISSFEQKINNTLQDLKKSEKLVVEEKNAEWADFKNILKEITDEANVVTSLDLTLAKDINDIISQLKEAIENVSDIIEGGSLDDATTQNLVGVVEELMIEFNNTQNAIDDETKAELKEVFNNILATIDSIIAKNQLDSSKLQFESSAKVLEVADSIKTINNLEVNQTEVIEFAENVVDEVKTLAGKFVQEESDSEFQEINIDEEIVKELKIESITADADMSNGENLMQRQAPEEYALKAMINDGAEVFDVKVEAPQGLQNTQNVQFKQVDVNPSRILNQITKHFEGLQNNSKVNIVLNPESLGKVNIQLLNAKDGLTAQFTVTTQEAKDLLMKGLDGLKDSLISQGVAVDNVSVKVADAQKSQYNQDWTEQEGSKGGNKEQERSNKEEKEKGLFEKMMAQVTDEENGNV